MHKSMASLKLERYSAKDTLQSIAFKNILIPWQIAQVFSRKEKQHTFNLLSRLRNRSICHVSLFINYGTVFSTNTIFRLPVKHIILSLVIQSMKGLKHKCVHNMGGCFCFAGDASHL